ncbi:MAG: hypothetical protein GXP24_04795 [Planctomycetes bacterium]|nr:hypothetical protein [Planctomycetota bacterium]
MRLLPWLVLAISLALASTVEARLFWQTYGSTVPAAGGYGCTWNWNQDFFIPRHPSSGRYGLTSPCKSNRYTSPASPHIHPLYPGYSSIYGPCHYRRRNHVYSTYCGCSPLLAYGSDGKAPATGCCAAASASDGGVGCICGEPVSPLANVEPASLDILGSIPVEGSGLLTQSDLSQLGNESSSNPVGGQMLDPKSILQQLQGLPLPKLPPFSQP